jgi:hypothetical protein
VQGHVDTGNPEAFRYIRHLTARIHCREDHGVVLPRLAALLGWSLCVLRVRPIILRQINLATTRWMTSQSNPTRTFVAVRGETSAGTRTGQHFSYGAWFEVQRFANDFEGKDRALPAPKNPALGLIPLGNVAAPVASNAFFENRQHQRPDARKLGAPWFASRSAERRQEIFV